MTISGATCRASRERRQGAGEPPLAVELGLAPVSQAVRIANGFLVWYLLGSMVWIVASDQALRLLAGVLEIPSWLHSAKGIAYVIIFGLALRRAARTYVQGVEAAHTGYIEAKLELVRRLALAAEYRDDDTGGHNARIGFYSSLVAAELGFDPKACETLSYAAALHDLGKIGISDSLLLKPGPFSPEERMEMERHTTLGAEILSGSRHPLVLMSHVVALTHHERWDGQGYPYGLKGTQIPIEGRIVAVCDVFDALTTQRPYKEAWSTDEAVDEIVSHSGSHFDPDVVAAFLRCLAEIENGEMKAVPHPTFECVAESVLQPRAA
ncbi:HD domain-containing protein [bacterium]|nr:MAG: HD domain-containing protein [bacterium]